jgi:hypothetical protein
MIRQGARDDPAIVFVPGIWNRLIEHERSLNPTAAEETLMEAAIERWERDSR